MQVGDLVAFKDLVADAEHGAAQADGGGVFDREGHGTGGGAEMAAALSKGGLAVGSQVKFAGRIEDLGIHFKSIGLSAGMGRPDECKRHPALCSARIEHPDVSWMMPAGASGARLSGES
jgi:hypothetical protein